MDRLMLRYTVKPEHLDRNLQMVRAVYTELHATRPDGLRYVTFQLEDDLAFVDIAWGKDLPGPLPQLEAFRRFRVDLEERCSERVVTEFTEVDSYGLWA